MLMYPSQFGAMHPRAAPDIQYVQSFRQALKADRNLKIRYLEIGALIPCFSGGGQGLRTIHRDASLRSGALETENRRGNNRKIRLKVQTVDSQRRSVVTPMRS